MNMKAGIIAACACLIVANAISAEGGARRLRPRESFEMKRFGGRVRKPESAKGKVVFLNAQKLIEEKELANAFEEIESRFNIQWELKTAEKVNVANPASDIAATGAQLGVVLIDNKESPSLLVAPESGWAMVNVGALRGKATDHKIVARRARVEVMRAFGLIAGASFMGRDQIVLRGDILSPEDLDLVTREKYGIETGAAIARGLTTVGIRPWHIATYRVACEQGWAPAPTNDIQKAIWDKVHEIPSKPLKIEYNEKRDKGK